MTLKALESPSSMLNERTPQATSPASRFLRFGAISGLGWLLDFALLYVLVRWAHLPVFSANLLSASLAAVFAFLLSHKLAFQGRSDSLALRVLFYCSYTLVIILLASWAISYVSAFAKSFSSSHQLQLATSTCAILAKLIVTPINFLTNFLVARFTSEYATKSSS